MRISPWLSLLIGFSLVLSDACSHHGSSPGPSRETTYRSSRRIPQWVTKRPDIPGSFVAVGIATGLPSLQEAQQAAVAAAVSEIITYLGIQAKVIFNETRTQLTTQLRDQITTRGAGRVVGGRTIKMHFEEHQQFFNGRPTRTYDVYVLVAIPYAQLDEERQRIHERSRARRALAARIFQDGVDAREAGNFQRALLRWLYLLSMLEGDDEAQTILSQAQSEIARLVDDLEIQGESPVASTFPQRVKVQARLHQEDRMEPLPMLPLRFFFLQGHGTVDGQMRTDENGTASVEVRSVASQRGPVLLAAGVDVERLLSTQEALPSSTSSIVTSSLTRLKNKMAQMVLVAAEPPDSAHGHLPLRPVPAVATRSRTAVGHGTELFPPAVAISGGSPEDSIEIRLVPGNERIFAPDGRPETCLADLIEIIGPASASAARQPLNLALVLDGSGSMGAGGKLEYLKQAAGLMVTNLTPRDVFSLVTYATEVKVVRSAGTVSDSTVTAHMIDMMRASGMTNLSGGLMEGIRQAQIYDGLGMVSRVILVSDGLANRGITDPSVLVRYVERAAERGVSVTTVGLGEEFDDELLMALANVGYGNYYYVSDPDEIPAILSNEMHGLARVLAQNLTVSLTLEPNVKFLNSLGIPYQRSGGQIVFRVGQVSAGQRVRVAFQLELPAGTPGPMHFGRVEVTYDSIVNPEDRIRHELPLQGVYTQDSSSAAASANDYVNRFVHVLGIMDAMVLAKKSGSQSAIYEMVTFLDREVPRLRTWIEGRDDQEMTELLGMLEHCRMILLEELRRPSGHSSRDGKDIAKELSYKLYRLHHHPVWEHDDG